MERASHEEVICAAAGEFRFPAGVNENVQGERRVGRIVQVAVEGPIEVGQDAHSGVEMHDARVGDETRKLGGGVGDLAAGHVGQPKESTDKSHVDGFLRGHLVCRIRVRRGAVIVGEAEPFFHRRVVLARVSGAHVRRVSLDQFLDVELLGQGKCPGRAVAVDSNAQHPFEFRAVVDREAFAEVGDEAWTLPRYGICGDGQCKRTCLKGQSVVLQPVLDV